MMSDDPTAAIRRRRGLWLLGACVIAGVGFVVWLNRGPSQSPSARPPETSATRPSPQSAPLPLEAAPVPPFATSRYQNAGPEAKYVGIEACAECHRANHASYRLTAHSRALSDLDPKAEPPDGSFQHPLSGRSYRVYREGTQFRHEETLRTAEGKEVARVDLPVRYLVGSGHFSRSYLVEVDGFLYESPITWYTSKNKWDMSPGYDAPGHWSFERPVGVDCLACHAGRVEEASDTTRAILHEKAIGCESCHGPGSLHAELHRANKPAPGQEDLTIVNPGKLPRDRLEAVCANCHLHGAITVPPRGRKVNAFRPGTPLTDARIDYRFDTGSDQMTVVGHVEQLRLSACYQKSGDLTCITCHDPHAKEPPKDPVAFYRQKCLSCHDTHGCSLGREQRLKQEPADNCAACHMPRGNTDIPHIAFTHHRIGKHGPRQPARPERVTQLVPTDDVSHLPAFDRQRNLGLAYVWLADNAQYVKYADAFRERGRDLLEPLHAAGLRDGLVTQALAAVYWRKDPGRAGAYAQEALGANDVWADVRAGALVIRADCLVQEGRTTEAVGLLEKLVLMRRRTEDWRLLGRLYLDLNQPRKALPAFQQALSIRPYRYDVHGGLAEVYRRLGDAAHAREHVEKSQWLWRHRQE